MDSWEPVLTATRRVAVFNCGMADGEPVTPDPPALIVEGDDFSGLLKSLAIGELSGSYCMCLGEITFHLFDEHGQILAQVALHHGASLRWDGWDSDALLLDGPSLVSWLDAHGISEPAARIAAAQAMREQSAQEADSWVSAAPTGVRPVIDQLLQTSSTGSQPPALLEQPEQALSVEFPDLDARCAAVLRWHSAGSGRRSGYPLHEGYPDKVLDTMPIATVIEAASTTSDAAVQLGAARHLSGWKARTPAELAQVPDELSSRLISLSREHGRTDVADALERLLSRD